MQNDKPIAGRSAPLVSIIIPTFNRKELLEEAVNSCLAQTYPNLEVFIVDDGSTDGTEEVVLRKLVGEWASKAVQYRKQVNAGASAARNTGLALAGGAYVQFLDSDDILMPDKLELQISELEKKEHQTAEG